VRFLTNSAGALTDSYDYDAFGNLINSTGSTPNVYLFAGEQYDPALGVYYNRARYLNTSTGRFWTIDTQEPNLQDPTSLHHYLYGGSNPVDNVDPTGLYTQQFGYDVEDAVDEQYEQDFGYDPQLVSFGGWARVGAKSRSAPYSLKPDILDRRLIRGNGSVGMIWMEIKPLSLSGIAAAGFAWGVYSSALSPIFRPDVNWLIGGDIFQVDGNATFVFNAGGILFYTTNQKDYQTFEEAIQATAGLAGAVTIGVAGAQLANLIAKLPQTSSVGSEVIDISSLARTAIQASEAETGLDTAVGF
jgi:RHS repeat-associated protein